MKSEEKKKVASIAYHVWGAATLFYCGVVSLVLGQAAGLMFVVAGALVSGLLYLKVSEDD